VAGTVWLNAFLRTNSTISICHPEATIHARALIFNHASVSRFSENLFKVLDEPNSRRIMCLTFVQAPIIIVAEIGKSQVGLITYSDHVTLVTSFVAVGDTGNCLTPIFEVPRKRISWLFS
jgi:hypothetical protein